MKELSVAIVGITGAVGEAMLEILESRDFPVKDLVVGWILDVPFPAFQHILNLNLEVDLFPKLLR